MTGNLVLIGMPASGKSTLGRYLAKRLSMKFCDTDDVLKKKLGGSLQETIDREGISAFLRKEEEAVLSLREEGAVIATGGSVVYSEKAMEHLCRDGFVVFLSVPFSSIKQRLQNLESRGVAISEEKSLFELYRERTRLYHKYANLVFHEDDSRGDLSMEEYGESLISILPRTFRKEAEQSL